MLHITARLYIFTMHGTLSYRCRVNGRVRVVSSMEPPNALLCVEGVNPCGIPSKLPEALPVPFFVVLVVLKVFGNVDTLLMLSLMWKCGWLTLGFE